MNQPVAEAVAPPKLPADVVSPGKVPEVRAFLKAQTALDELREHYPAAWRRLLEIASEYNATLALADDVVRARRVTCGPFVLKTYVATYDLKAFVEAVGRTEFVRLGGGVVKTEQLTFDATRFKALVAQQKIPEDVAAKVVTYGPRYDRPKPIALP